jgi:hypothetical protein
MQHTELLHNILDKSGAIQHKGRLKSVMAAVSSVMSGANLDLTSMGRHMNKEIKPKSKIKEIDYLVSNGHLHRERLRIYQSINEWIIGQEKLLFIAIDWSSIVAHQHHLLRASIIRKGRCITVYEEIFPQEALGTGDSHQTFLRNLKLVLPENRDICIIVDAGFRTDFFIQVQTKSWEYVGRILSTMHYTAREEDDWKPCTSLYEQATSEPEAIGRVTLAKSNKLDSQLYLYKKVEEETAREKAVKVRTIKHGKKEKDYGNAAKKPWLIASSLEIPARKIMAIYKMRMKIEHDFRDSKDPKWGLGIKESRSSDPMRLILQLLIGFLASVILWLIGLCLEKKGLHRDFQANSIKHKRVLSLIFLALEAIRSGYMKFIDELDFYELRQSGLDDEILSAQIL